jgi:hypothetical protein
MSPGHLGIALAAKPIVPKVPLWTLLTASEALDLLSFGFIAIGLENVGVTQSSIAQGLRIVTPASVPWSHGLFMSIVWSALAAAITYLVFRDRLASVVMGLVVFSHWILDFIVYLPDLPLFLAGSPTVGLSLWGSGPGFIFSTVLDIGLFIGGMVIYILWRRKKGDHHG